MGEYTSVTCDGDDCYATAHDIVSADYAHEETEPGDPLFVVVKWIDTSYGIGLTKYATFCTDCAERMNFEPYRRADKTVHLPAGFTEGKPCQCSEDRVHPWGYWSEGDRPMFIDDPDKEPWADGRPKTKMNPDYKQIRCESCSGSGWHREPKYAEVAA